jgi:hypothetical protein
MASRKTRSIKWTLIAIVLLVGGGVAGTALTSNGIGTFSLHSAAKRQVSYGGQQLSLSPIGGTGAGYFDTVGSGPVPLSASDGDELSGQKGPISADDRIIKTGDITLDVGDKFEQAWEAAKAVATRFHGRVLSSNRGTQDNPDGGEPLVGELVIRVPAAEFDDASAAVRKLGTIRSETSNAQDVGEEYVDLTSRLRNLRAEQKALLRLFARADAVRDTLAVQQRLSDVEGEIEQTTGRIRFFDERIEFSRITVRIGEAGAHIIASDTPTPSFGGAWELAWKGLLRIIAGTMIAIIWVSPFALIALLVIVLRRRRHGDDDVAPATEV